MRILVIEDEALIADLPIDRVADAARIGRLPPTTSAIVCADRARGVRWVLTAGASPGVR
jgi:hypothetical protein